MRRPSPCFALGFVVVSSFACAGRSVVQPQAVELNKAGAYALTLGDLDVAQARLELAVEYQPNFVEAWINLGLLALARGELAQAERRFRRALALEPEAAAAHVGLGALAERSGDASAAEGAYRAALGIDPGLAEPRANLARLLAARGALDEARDHLRRLVEVQADDPAGWLALCEVLWRLGRDLEAARVVDEARARLGPGPEVELLLARRDLRAGALDEAASRLGPLAREPGALGRAAGGWYAVVKLEQGDVVGARSAARAVLARDPEDAVARAVMARTGP